MKIHREIKSNERLPTKEGNYWTIRKVGKLKSIEYFIPNYNPELWIAANEYWLEPIEIELDSEKILPKESRYLGELTNVTDAEIDKWLQSYHEALEAAELQIIRLKEQYIICKEIADIRKEQVDLLTSCDRINSNETIEFAEWIAKYQYERDEDDGLWRYWDNGIGEHTTEELFNIFKKEIHGTTQSTTTL